jgi:hypothetical protein
MLLCQGLGQLAVVPLQVDRVASSVGLSKLQKRQRWHVYFARKYLRKAFHVSMAL